MTEVTSEPVVTTGHVRAAKLCMRGARVFAKRHNLDFKDFALNGIPVSVLEEIGDPLVAPAVTLARGDRSG